MTVPTFKDFLKQCYDAFQDSENASWIPESFLDPKSHEEQKAGRYGTERTQLTFEASWSMGGTSGNCWDDHLTTISAGKEPEFPVEFYTILNTFCPDISAVKTTLLLNMVSKEGTYVNSDYYGGSETTGYKGFRIKDMYDAMVELGLFEPAEGAVDIAWLRQEVARLSKENDSLREDLEWLKERFDNR